MYNMVNCVGAYPASAANTCLFGVVKRNRENQSGLVTWVASTLNTKLRPPDNHQLSLIHNPLYVLLCCAVAHHSDHAHVRRTFQGFIRGRYLQDFKSVCKYTNLDCRPPKIYNTQFLLPLNGISKQMHTFYADNLHTKCIIDSSWQLVGQQGVNESVTYTHWNLWWS